MMHVSLLGLLSILSAAQKQKDYPPKLDGARVEVYKQVGDVKLLVHIFQPPQHKATDRRPAIVFFFGGGWKQGTPAQFQEHCRYLASRGMLAMTADYRVSSRHQTKALHCVEDGKSAVRWIRRQAARLGVDPHRIVAGGGSAGGHVAACTGVVKGFEASGEDGKISSVPNALALFNPAVVLAPLGSEFDEFEKRAAEMRERMGVEPVRLSPAHHVRKQLPPTVIFHGKADTTVRFRTVEVFTEKMKQAGNRCELNGYEGATHGFFNLGRNGGKHYRQTVRQLDQFLVSLGYLKGPATIE